MKNKTDLTIYRNGQYDFRANLPIVLKRTAYRTVEIMFEIKALIDEDRAANR